MYKPTVRYDDRFRMYIDDLAKETGLDKVQIMRLALFLAPTNTTFIEKLKERAKLDHVNSAPTWNHKDDTMWLNQTGKTIAPPQSSGQITIKIGGGSVVI